MTQQEVIANSRRSLLIYAERHGITAACQAFGVSRTTFYKLKEQFIKTGSLIPLVRRKPRMPNETCLSRKKLILKIVQEHPAAGPKRIAWELRMQGVAIDPVTVWRCLYRFNLSFLLQPHCLLVRSWLASPQASDFQLAFKSRVSIKSGAWTSPISVLGKDSYI